jgi:hypothetical protein
MKNEIKSIKSSFFKFMENVRQVVVPIVLKRFML